MPPRPAYDFTTAPDPSALGARPWLRALVTLALVLLLAIVLAAAQTWRWATHDLPRIPDAQALWSVGRPPGIAFVDRQNRLLAVRGSRHGRAVRLSEMPASVPRAFMAAEDRRFYEHDGVDWRGVARALRENYRAGRTVQGGSTLTQQLVRTVFLTPERTFRRKAQEALLAHELEQRLTKDAILELYLNRVFFGENAYGVDAAARTYFGKSARDLTLSEAALLASLPKAPSRLAPTDNFDAAVERSRLVLRLMRQEGWITTTQYNTALARPPRLVPLTGGEGDLSWIFDLASRQARAIAGPGAPDLVVRVTVDPALQTRAQQILTRAIEREGRRLGARQAALVTLGPDGSVRALVGGTSWRDSPFNRAVQARRQPGSAFKPFVYAAALEYGAHPGDVRVDRPVRLAGWSPDNYGGGHAGSMTLSTALAFSINTIAAQLASEVGSQRLGDIAQRFGLNSIPERPGLSVALGAYEVSLLELTGGFQVFQLGGRRIDPWLVDQITTARGDVLYRHVPSAGLPVYDPRRNAQMVAMMTGVVTNGTGYRAAFGGRPIAAKTGTSQNWRDAWFVGFTADYVTGVWVGDDRNRRMSQVVGGELPADIWRRVMQDAHQNLPVRPLVGLGARPPTTTQAAASYREAFYAQLARDLAAEGRR